jgi:hypothetical protein
VRQRGARCGGSAAARSGAAAGGRGRAAARHRRARLFSTTTTLGTAQDITLQEPRIESFHPADAATEELVRAMGRQ